jgi:DnaJ domain
VSLAGEGRMEDPFEILQIKPGATGKEITAAYRRLVKVYHPDVQRGDDQEQRREAERRMLELNNARRILRSRSVSVGGKGAHATLLTSHYLVFEVSGQRSSLLYLIRDENGAILGEVKILNSRDRGFARQRGPRYSIGPTGSSLLEVSQLLGRVVPMVKVEDYETETVLGHIARRNGGLWIESLSAEREPVKLEQRRDYFVVESDGKDMGRIERSGSRDEGFVVTASPEVDEELRFFLIAAPLAVKELT